jgi:hypothetical protein
MNCFSDRVRRLSLFVNVPLAASTTGPCTAARPGGEIRASLLPAS